MPNLWPFHLLRRYILTVQPNTEIFHLVITVHANGEMTCAIQEEIA
jgi:hypothetical protein